MAPASPRGFGGLLCNLGRLGRLAPVATLVADASQGRLPHSPALSALDIMFYYPAHPRSLGRRHNKHYVKCHRQAWQAGPCFSGGQGWHQAQALLVCRLPGQGFLPLRYAPGVAGLRPATLVYIMCHCSDALYPIPRRVLSI